MRMMSRQQSHPETLDSALLDERTFDARADFHDVFDLLMCARALADRENLSDSAILENRIANELQILIQSNAQRLYKLPRDKRYSRHIIGTQNDWIGYVCRWEKQVASEIHGHPNFVYYQVLEGEFAMDLYKLDDTQTVKYDQSLNMNRGDTIWQSGPAKTYDNLIHRVSTGDSPGFTLHLFSEDPCMGKHFALR